MAWARQSQDWHRRDIASTGAKDPTRMLSVSSDGYVFITGHAPEASGGSILTTWRYEPNGSLSSGWPKTFGSSATTNFGMCVLAADEGGACTVAGAVTVSGQGLDIVVLKYEANGSLASGFPVYYDNGAQHGDEYPVDMDIDAGGGIWVGAVSDGAGTATDYLLVGWDSVGTFLDSHAFDRGQGKDDVLVDIAAYAIVSAPSALTIGISVTGTSYSSSTLEDIVTLHYTYSFSGGLALAGTAVYDGPGGSTQQFATGLAYAGNTVNDVDVFVCGYTNAPVGGQNVGLNFATVAYLSRSTTEDWENIYNRPTHNGNDIARRIHAAINPDGNLRVYVSGTSWGGSSASNDIVTFAYDRGGGTSWQWNLFETNDDILVDMVAVTGGDVYLMTKRYNGSNYDYRTVKIEGDTGQQGWLAPPIYNAPPVGGFDEPLAVRIRLDPQDTSDPERTPFVYVSGRSLGATDNGMKYATVKYHQ